MNRPEDKVLADLEELTGARCAWCRGPIGASTSADFCCEDHQRAWSAQDTEALPPDEQSPLEMLLEAAMAEADQQRLRSAMRAKLTDQRARLVALGRQRRRANRWVLAAVLVSAVVGVARPWVAPISPAWVDVVSSVVWSLVTAGAPVWWHGRALTALTEEADAIASEPASVQIESEHGVIVRFTIADRPDPADDGEDGEDGQDLDDEDLDDEDLDDEDHQQLDAELIGEAR